VKIRITRRAQARIRLVRTLWEGQRDKIRGLFREELEDAKKHLLATPKLAQLYTRIDGVSIWRVLRPKTEHHVYYVVDEEADEVGILTVWGARRRRPPKF
jgi:plasmid stabilization system protein ParE